MLAAAELTASGSGRSGGLLWRGVDVLTDIGRVRTSSVHNQDKLSADKLSRPRSPSAPFLIEKQHSDGENLHDGLQPARLLFGLSGVSRWFSVPAAELASCSPGAPLCLCPLQNLPFPVSPVSFLLYSCFHGIRLPLAF